MTCYYIGDTTAPIPTQSYHDADHESGPAIWVSNKPGRLPGSKSCEKILLHDILEIYELRLVAGNSNEETD